MLHLDWISLLLIVSIALGTLICAIVAINISKFKLANSLLLIHLSGMCVLGLMNFLNHSGFIINVPILYRIPSFIFYLIAPAAYLYVKTIANDTDHLKKWDYINFLPAFLHFFELLPYHLLPLAEKQQIILQAIANPKLIYALNEGVLPAYWHHFIRTSLAFIYGIAMVLQALKLSRLSKKSPDFSKETVVWLYFFSWMLLLLSSVVLTGELINSIFPISVFNFYSAGICFLYIGMLYYLFLNPNILYGAPRLFSRLKYVSVSKHDLPDLNEIIKDSEKIIPDEKLNPENNSIINKYNESFAANKTPSSADETSNHIIAETFSTNPVTEKNYDYLKSYQFGLEQYMAESKPFLKAGYSIGDMSEETGIPQHHLSALLNKIFGVRFNDYINQYRIDYLTETMDNPKYQQLSVEGIAQSVGFSSRISFFNALKKIKGVTPTEFLKLEKSSEPA